MKKIGFIGTGVMGLPMARNVIKGGFEVTAFDINADALQTLRQDGGGVADNAKGAAQDADVVITMLPNGDHVLNAVFGPNGAIEGMGPQTVLVDMSTILPTVTDEIASRLSETGHRMVDAPVGRTSRHAEEGKLLIMAGGETADVEAVHPILECMGDTVIHCGSTGSGARVKLINNYMSIACNV
ncbi:MAG: NAD(P)-binding domain-containing protein, partial [Pseudomonadota bacterium]